jgi:hypothetical protein
MAMPFHSAIVDARELEGLIGMARDPMRKGRNWGYTQWIPERQQRLSCDFGGCVCGAGRREERAGG